jgi:hypothetical protein
VRDQHVCAAVGRDYDDAAPLRGVFVAAEPGETPEVEVVIRRLAPTLSSPRGGGEIWPEQ